MKQMLEIRPISKKGMSPGAAVSFVLLIAVISIIAVLVHQINADARDDLTAGSYGANSTIEADKGIFKITSNLDLVGLAVAFGLVLAIILGAIAFKKSF